jgi:hypothetical protein
VFRGWHEWCVDPMCHTPPNHSEPDFPVAWSLAHLHKLTALAHNGPDYEEFLPKVQGVDS